jgi:isoleucyl-tRNA synthetase
MDVLKDRLYCDGADSVSRRSGQTAMYAIFDGLVRMLTPILAHTSEEAWSAMKFKSEDVESVHLASMPKADESLDWVEQEPKWEKMMGLRDEVLGKLEERRQNQIIRSNQEAAVKIRTTNDDLVSLIKDQITEKEFAAICIVSEVEIEKLGGGLYEGKDYKDITKEFPNIIDATKSPHQKCQRCWNYWPSVGKDSDHPDLCERCTAIVTRAS